MAQCICFDTQKHVQPLDDPPQILKMYSGIQQIHIIVYNRICCTSCFKLNG